MAFVDEVSVEPGVLGSVGAMVSGVTPVLSAVGGLSGMFGSGKGTDVSKAVSGGTFMTGELSTGKSDAALIIIAFVVLGLLILFKGKSKWASPGHKQ